MHVYNSICHALRRGLARLDRALLAVRPEDRRVGGLPHEALLHGLVFLFTHCLHRVDDHRGLRHSLPRLKNTKCLTSSVRQVVLDKLLPLTG